jgi:hypothetical protein
MQLRVKIDSSEMDPDFDRVNAQQLFSEVMSLKNTYKTSVFGGLMAKFIRGHQWGFTQAIVCGLGTMQTKRRKYSLFQLILFMDIVEMLPNRNTIQVYAADPNFSVEDRNFLQNLGVIVLDGGNDMTAKILETVTHSSFIFTPFLVSTVIGEILSVVAPELYIGPILEGVNNGISTLMFPNIQRYFIMFFGF